MLSIRGLHVLPVWALPAMPGLNIGQVERKRKEMQRRMFQKCGDMEKSDVLAEEVAVEDIERPENVNSIF